MLSRLDWVELVSGVKINSERWLYMWMCNRCHWTGKQLERIKAKREGEADIYAGCPRCEAHLDDLKFDKGKPKDSK